MIKTYAVTYYTCNLLKITHIDTYSWNDIFGICFSRGINEWEIIKVELVPAEEV